MSSRERDDDPCAAEVDERDQGVWAVEAEAAVADEPDAAVEAFQSSVGKPETDRGEDPVAVTTDGPGELGERLQPRPGCPGQPAVEVCRRERGILELVEESELFL
jgi:hypothetical protein